MNAQAGGYTLAGTDEGHSGVRGGDDGEEGRRKAKSSKKVRLPDSASLAELPDLMDRIGAMGIADEYLEFKARYQGWRQGQSKGARGDMSEFRNLGNMVATSSDIVHAKTPAPTGGFGYWYPTIHDWRWSRSVSYWIAITFFIGSIFFTISSFAFNYPELLGRYKFPLTTGGYLAGKVCFFICTYLMCFETINLTALGHTDKGSSSDSESDSSSDDGYERDYKFNPFRWRQALRNLKELGAGPYPYYASVIYFMGVLVFGIGLAAEFAPIDEELEALALTWSFFFGSLLFTLGGLMECIENQVFTTCSLNKGWLGAFFNLLGGVGFLVGAVLAWVDAYWSNFAYGVGSLTFLLGSSTMIIMWKDEQYGLTFLAVLNELTNETPGSAMSRAGESTARTLNRLATGELDFSHISTAQQTFSKAGAMFIHVYCFAIAFSVYNFNMEMVNVYEERTFRTVQLAFNELMPAIACTMVLALASAVVRLPRIAPYRQLFIAIRALSVVLVLNSVATTSEFVFHNLKK